MCSTPRTLKILTLQCQRLCLIALIQTSTIWWLGHLKQATRAFTKSIQTISMWRACRLRSNTTRLIHLTSCDILRESRSQLLHPLLNKRIRDDIGAPSASRKSEIDAFPWERSCWHLHTLTLWIELDSSIWNLFMVQTWDKLSKWHFYSQQTYMKSSDIDMSTGGQSLINHPSMSVSRFLLLFSIHLLSLNVHIMDKKSETITPHLCVKYQIW